MDVNKEIEEIQIQLNEIIENNIKVKQVQAERLEIIAAKLKELEKNGYEIHGTVWLVDLLRNQRPVKHIVANPAMTISKKIFTNEDTVAQ